MSSPSPQLPVGQLIGGRYRIQSVIGRGGMGLVYAAVHELTGRRVAVKLMLSEYGESSTLQDRFLSEARIAAAVRHPNIVDVLDMGIHEGAPFLVMELLEGISLERLLEAQTRLSAEQALAWLLPIVGALAVLHDAGIVHRDVKPSNIFLSSLPRHPIRPKLLDFGLARVMSDLRLTRSGNVIGTPLYMAPEHASGRVAGPQADIWSVGVVLYECLTGDSPFEYTDRASLAAQVLAGVVRPLSQLRPDLPDAFSVCVAKALQRDLGRRYPDMRSFARALHAAARVSQVALPSDPDPIGLPEYTSWQTGERGAATTVDHCFADLRMTPTHSRSYRSTGPRSTNARPPQPRRVAPGALLMLLIGLTLLVYGLAGRPSSAGSKSVQSSAVAPPLPTVPRTVETLPLPTVESLLDRPAPVAPHQDDDAGVRDGARQSPQAARPRRPVERVVAPPPRRPALEELEPVMPATVEEIEAEWK